MSNQLTVEQLHQKAPSIFATAPWEQVSDRYAFVPTVNVVERLQTEGFVPVAAKQSNSRIPGKAEFTKHLLRFRQLADLNPSTVGEIVPEIVLVNSHDRTSSYQLSAGLFRLVCLNGLVVADATFASIRITHSGNIVNDVIDASYKIVSDFPKLLNRVEEFKSIILTGEQQHAFADKALGLRYYNLQEGHQVAPITTSDLLRPRRHEDEAPNLWAVYNRVQENLIKGGQRIVSRSFGQARRTRGVRSVTSDLNINRGLWALACDFVAAN